MWVRDVNRGSGPLNIRQRETFFPNPGRDDIVIETYPSPVTVIALGDNVVEYERLDAATGEILETLTTQAGHTAEGQEIAGVRLRPAMFVRLRSDGPFVLDPDVEAPLSAMGSLDHAALVEAASRVPEPPAEDR